MVDILAGQKKLCFAYQKIMHTQKYGRCKSAREILFREAKEENLSFAYLCLSLTNNFKCFIYAGLRVTESLPTRASCTFLQGKLTETSTC